MSGERAPRSAGITVTDDRETAGRAPRTLASVDREIMLRNARRVAARLYDESTLRSFVSYVCGVGSTSAGAICRELGWEPDATVRPRTSPTPSSEAKP